MKRTLRNVLTVIALIMALTLAGCGSAPADQTDTTAAETGAEVTFTLVVTDLDGTETRQEITTDKTIVGEALLEQGIITGEEGPYGMYIHAVNGITAVYEEDGTYWALYIDGEYSLEGVDSVEVDPNCVYSLVRTKG